MNKFRRIFLISLILLWSMLTCSGCTELKQMINGENSEEEEVDDGTIKLSAQLGEGTTFGNKKLKWLATTDKDILEYYTLTSKQVEITDHQLTSVNAPLMFSDMHVASSSFTFTFADNSHLQMNRYEFDFHYEDERVRKADLKKLQAYIEEKFKLYSETELADGTLYKMKDLSFCQIRVFDEFAPDGQYQMEVLVSQGASDVDNTTDWEEYSDLIGKEREEAMESMKALGLSMSSAVEGETRSTARRLSASPKETIFGYELNLSFAVEETVTGYAKSYTGTVYHDAAFLMKFYDFLVSRYGTPQTLPEGGTDLTLITNPGWDRFFGSWCRQTVPEDTADEETGEKYRTLKAYWPKEDLSLTVTVCTTTELKDELKLRLQYGEMPDLEEAEEPAEDQEKGLIEDSSVEVK